MNADLAGTFICRFQYCGYLLDTRDFTRES